MSRWTCQDPRIQLQLISHTLDKSDRPRVETLILSPVCFLSGLCSHHQILCIINQIKATQTVILQDHSGWDWAVARLVRCYNSSEFSWRPPATTNFLRFPWEGNSEELKCQRDRWFLLHLPGTLMTWKFFINVSLLPPSLSFPMWCVCSTLGKEATSLWPVDFRWKLTMNLLCYFSCSASIPLWLRAAQLGCYRLTHTPWPHTAPKSLGHLVKNGSTVWIN